MLNMTKDNEAIQVLDIIVENHGKDIYQNNP